MYRSTATKTSSSTLRRALRKRALLSVTCALLAGWVGAALAGPPKEFVATYKAKYGGIPVTAIRTLKTLANGHQQYSFEADSWIASLSEKSELSWTADDRVVPHLYQYERSGLGRDRSAHLTFNWDTKTVINDVDSKPWQMEVPALVLDKLSYQLQLRTDLINEKPLLEYDIADGGRIKKYRFEVIGEESLNTKIGTFATIKIRRLRDEEEDRQTVLWMAKQWDYLIVRLQQEDGSKSYEIDITEATLGGEKVRGLQRSD